MGTLFIRTKEANAGEVIVAVSGGGTQGVRKPIARIFARGSANVAVKGLAAGIVNIIAQG